MHENQSVGPLWLLWGWVIYCTVKVPLWAAASSVLIEFKRHSYMRASQTGPPWLNWSQWLLLSSPESCWLLSLIRLWLMCAPEIGWTWNQLPGSPWRMETHRTAWTQISAYMESNSDGDLSQRHGAYGCGLMDPTMCLASKQGAGTTLALETGSGWATFWCDWPEWQWSSNVCNLPPPALFATPCAPCPFYPRKS